MNLIEEVQPGFYIDFSRVVSIKKEGVGEGFSPGGESPYRILILKYMLKPEPDIIKFYYKDSEFRNTPGTAFSTDLKLRNGDYVRGWRVYEKLLQLGLDYEDIVGYDRIDKEMNKVIDKWIKIREEYLKLEKYENKN